MKSARGSASAQDGRSWRIRYPVERTPGNEALVGQRVPLDNPLKATHHAIHSTRGLHEDTLYAVAAHNAEDLPVSSNVINCE